MLERYFGYKPPIPEDLRNQYETALHGVERWKNGNWADNIKETDWDHVIGMFSVLSDIKKACPTLSFEVDIPTVEHMIYIHDLGEIEAGDLTHNRHDYHDVYDAWKRREQISGKWIIRRNAKDRDIRIQAMEFFDRYSQKRDDDKEALLTDLIDKIQGSRFGFKNVFHGRRMIKAQREMQFNHTIELITKPTKPLLKLVSPSTQVDLKKFLAEELERFSQYGYKKEATPYIRNLEAILQ